MRVLAEAGEFSPPAAGETASWVEHLQVADLSVGSYSVPAGGCDRQLPHPEDEWLFHPPGRSGHAAGYISLIRLLRG